MKTAIETLFDRIEEIWFIDPAAGQFYEEVISLKEQAKEMEKEQIKDAYIIGRTGGTIKDFNETFKSE